MRTIAMALAASLLGAAAAAQPAAPPAPLPPLPKAFAEYSQPEIAPGLCKNVSPTETQCTIPPMTAGLYEITATGTSTSTAADAVQKIVVVVGRVACGAAQTDPKKLAWPANTAKTLRYNCLANILTDKPLVVTVEYADAKATKDPKGPTLAFKRVPWTGVLMIQQGPAAQQ